MKRNGFETLLGALVIAIAAAFLYHNYQVADLGSDDGYSIYADFSSIGGLKQGDDVVISGVKVGAVEAVKLNPESFLAEVKLHIENGIELPADTAALISSESLLGGLFLALEPGGEEDIIEAGGRIEYTQAPQNLEQLLGQFIFSLQGDDKEE